MMAPTNQRYDRGVVSLFIVIFAAIFMTIITVSFLGVMTHDQQQASENSLSQSAYDSALAGVADAKRAIVNCESGSGPHDHCDEMTNGAINCSMLTDILGLPRHAGQGGNLEYPLQQSEGGNTLNQAYTCVTIDAAPSTYKTDLNENAPLVVPLHATSDASSLKFSWQARTAQSAAAQFPPLGGGDIAAPLFPYDTWNTQHYPPVMRLQLIRLSGGATDFSSLNGSQVETRFLYPTADLAAAGPGEVNFGDDQHRREGTGPSPALTNCSADGVCTAILKDSGKSMAVTNGTKLFLVMTPLYSDAAVTLALPDASTHFAHLQAVVDATGRADDLFRRVEARVDLIPHPTYPNAALSLQGPLCKDFLVTTKASGYVSNCP